jgi:hypothetical protein
MFGRSVVRRASVVSGIAVGFALLGACDGSTYKGLDGRQALARANSMPLPEAYSFYLQTYKGVHPPMLDVAATFERFGNEGTAYLSERALQTSDRVEFEADLHALLVLGYRCDKPLREALANKSQRMNADISGQLACGSGS